MSYRVTLQRAGQYKALHAFTLSARVLMLTLFCVAVSVSEIKGLEAQNDSKSIAVTRSPSVLSTPKEYSIGPEDVLDIAVWGEAELSKTIAVSPEGTINYPLLGTLQVQGVTPEILEGMLREKLSQGYLKDPKITVSVKEFNSKKIMVFGLVGTPGLYKVRGALPLLELLFMVGNANNEGGLRLVVMRKDPKNPQGQPMPTAEINLDDLLLKGDLSKNIMIQPGDVVYITPAQATARRRFYVMGQVKQPGPYDFTKPLTLLEAIKSAGGLTEYASPRRVQVIRKEGDKKITLKFNINEISKGKKDDDFLVQPGDVIVVPESWF